MVFDGLPTWRLMKIGGALEWLLVRQASLAIGQVDSKCFPRSVDRKWSSEPFPSLINGQNGLGHPGTVATHRKARQSHRVLHYRYAGIQNRFTTLRPRVHTLQFL